LLAAFFAGLITGLGQAPFSLAYLALIGLFFGFIFFRTSISVKQASLVGWAFGTGYFALVLSWIIEPFLVDIASHGWMAPFALIGLSAGLALFWAAAFGLAFWQGRVLALVVFLTIAEIARTYVLTGFPWGLLGYIWLDWGLDQLAALIGPHGLTFITLLGVWGVCAALRQRGLRRGLSVLAVFGFGVAAYLLAVFISVQGSFSNIGAAIRKDGERGPPIVRLIQPNAPQHQKWDPQMMPVFFERSLALTASVSEAKPDLIIWPETSVPYLLSRPGTALADISQAAGDVPVVFGIQRTDGLQYFNSLVLLGADGEVRDVYDKSHLVPFGEYMPGGALAASLGLNGFAARGGFGFGAGDGLRAIDFGNLGLALPLICYEAIFPHEVGRTDERPDWLLQITNDAWFGNLTGPQQHLAQARFRAIEQGLPMVRVANTGISAVIDANGRIKQSLALGTAGFLDAELPSRLPATFYSRRGDIPISLLLIIATLMLLFKRRRLID